MHPDVSYPREPDTPVSHLPFSPAVRVGQRGCVPALPRWLCLPIRNHNQPRPLHGRVRCRRVQRDGPERSAHLLPHPTRFPPTLLTAGLHDNRVCYWEPAKYCQRLRAAAAEPGRILLKTDMGAGHFSYSDRYAGEEESAFELAFLLHHLK